MAKIIEHGVFWKEDQKKAYPDVNIKCPECGNLICISSYDIYITNPVPDIWCICGCKFIPEVEDIVNDIHKTKT